MKSPYFKDEHELFRQSVRQFVEKEILPFGDEWEKKEKIDRELFVKLGNQGFLGINHKEDVGGSDVDMQVLQQPSPYTNIWLLTI